MVVLLLLSSSSLVSLGPSIGPTPSLKPFLFSLVLCVLSLFSLGFISFFYCDHHDNYKELSQCDNNHMRGVGILKLE